MRRFGSRLALACLCPLVWLTACGSMPPSSNHSEPAADRERKASTSAPQIQLQPIPEREILLPAIAAPLPFPARGLSFQGSESIGVAQGGLGPIGDAAIGPDLSIFLSFPERDLVVAIEGVRGALRMMGSSAYGGKDEIIKNPDSIRFVGKDMYLANRNNGQILALGMDGVFRNAFQAPTPAALSGPGPQFLLSAPTSPGMLIRVDARNRRLGAYHLPANADGSPLNTPPLLDATDDWEVVALLRDMSALYHFDAQGKIQLALRLGVKGASGGLRARAVRTFEGQHWLLFNADGTEPACLLAVISPDGRLHHCWRLPMEADGFDLDANRILLFNRDAATAVTYARR